MKTSPKQLKNIALMEVQSNQCVIGIRARPSDSQTAQQVMQTLSEVLKTLNAAVVTGSSGQLCEAAMGQALHHQGLIKSERLSKAQPTTKALVQVNLLCSRTCCP